MQILMRRFSSPRDAGVLRATRGFLGVSNDDRSRAAHKLITDSADRVHTLRYVHEDIAVELDGQVMPIEDLGRALGDVAGTITIDATTLNVADMLILFRLL